MLFNSLHFAIFLVLLAAALAMLRPANRTIALIVGSYAFYGAWDIRFVPLLVAYTALGWFFGLWLHRSESQDMRRWILSGGVILSLMSLAFFKYADFLANAVLSLLNISSAGSFNIILPVGISFFTFEVVSYLVDIYRRDVSPPKSFWHFALFMAFFPRLVAGPIIRPHAFLPQTLKPIQFSAEEAWAGARLFLGGLVLKSVCADNLSVFVDAVYADVAAYSGGTLLFAAICYSGQIFADFCGYTLMAIGLARGLGFQLPPNFRMPYVAQSVTEFWRRWHISLSTWLRDYLYIPLGGSQRGELRTHINLMATMVLGGLWHGASWNFVLWGFCHGLALVVHRIWSRFITPQLGLGTDTLSAKIYGLLCWAATFGLVTTLWIPFRSPDFATTWLFLERALTLADGIYWMHTQSILIIVGMIGWHLFTLAERHIAAPWRSSVSPRLATTSAGMLLLVLFGQQEASPFIYFQF